MNALVEPLADAFTSAAVRLSRRYEREPEFSVIVNTVSKGGFTDDDGVTHPGPTLADAMLADRIVSALAAEGYHIIPLP